MLLSDYLETSYRPDCEYIDGEVLERNVGETDHSRLQLRLGVRLYDLENLLGITVLPSMRMQVKPTRIRVPDITVVAGQYPPNQILYDPPFICIEILSREDTMAEMQDRIDDYLTFGVPHVWVLNPRTRRGFLYTQDGMREAKDGVLRTANPDIAVPFSELK